MAEALGTLGYSSLWLAASGLLLWLCLRGRQLSHRTCAAASLLVVLQGWNWIGIPVPVDQCWLVHGPAHAAGQVAAPATSARAAPESHSSASVPAGCHWDIRRIGTAVCLAAWLCGVAVILWRSIRGLAALSRTVEALPAAPAEWQQRLNALCARLSIRGRIELKVSQVTPPMLVRTLRSRCIVFPAWLWAECTAEQQTSILLHELAHYRRHDLWRHLALRLLVLPHWFNPVAWWAARQFEAASEAACDDAACGGDPLRAVSYAKALLMLSERPGVRFANSSGIGGGFLFERVDRVLHPQSRKESRMSRVLVLSTILASLGLAAVRIPAAEPSPPGGNDSPPVAAASLVLNGGFEDVEEKTGDPQSWFGTRVRQTAGHYQLSVSRARARSGRHSVVVAIEDSHPDSRVDYNWTADPQGWQVGQRYELSGWVRAENAQRPAVMMVQFLSDEGKRLLGGATTEKTSPVTGTTDWTRVSTRFVVPEGTQILRIRTGLTSAGNARAKAWFDDLALVPVAGNQ